MFSYLLCVTEGTVAIQVLQQHFPCHLVHIPDESQSEQETPKGVLLVAHRPLLCGDPLAVLRHLCKSSDQLCVGGDFLRATGNMEPGESHLAIGYFVGKRIRPQCLSQQISFTLDDAVEVRTGCIRQGLLRQLNAKIVGVGIWHLLIR